MRHLDLEEVLEMMRRREAGGKGMGMSVGKLEGERWFTFEHDAGWRQVHTQFLGAVRSHGGSTSKVSCGSYGGRADGLRVSSDPNQLQALLSVYNWQIDTLLQMSAIYNQQGGEGLCPE